MPRVRIKQLDERVATSGLFMGESPDGIGLRPKLEPGDVVDIPEGALFETLWETGKLDLTRDPVTRPLDYESAKEAQFCSPTFKARGGPDEEREMLEVRAAVAERLTHQSASPRKAKSPAESRSADSASSSTSAPASGPRAGVDVMNRRAQRRAAVQGGLDDAEVSS